MQPMQKRRALQNALLLPPMSAWPLVNAICRGLTIMVCNIDVRPIVNQHYHYVFLARTKVSTKRVTVRNTVGV